MLIWSYFCLQSITMFNIIILYYFRIHNSGTPEQCSGDLSHHVCFELHENKKIKSNRSWKNHSIEFLVPHWYTVWNHQFSLLLEFCSNSYKLWLIWPCEWCIVVYYTDVLYRVAHYDTAISQISDTSSDYDQTVMCHIAVFSIVLLYCVAHHDVLWNTV